MKPLVIDLFCGLGGWTKGFLAEGYRAVGFDIERPTSYPGELILQDVLTLHGSQLRDAACIVASPPCQRYSYMAMPWDRAKREIRWQRWHQTSHFSPVRFDLNDLFDACFRIQREASAAAGRCIPMVLENVKGAQPWVGRAGWHYGSYYLWGDVPALMPSTRQLKRPGRNFHGPERGESSPSFNGGEHETRGVKGAEPMGGYFPRGSGKSSWFFGTRADPRDMRRNEDSEFTRMGLKNDGGSWFGVAHNTTSGHSQNPVAGEGVKVPGIKLSEVGFNVAAAQRYRAEREGVKQHGSRSDSRKAASAAIAEIPFDLAQWIARCFLPS